MLFNEIEHNDDVGDVAIATTLTFFHPQSISNALF